MRKRIRIRMQKRIMRRRDEPREDIKIPREVNARTKKKLADSQKAIEEIAELLRVVKIKEAKRLIQSFRCLPRVPNCEGRMVDLR